MLKKKRKGKKRIVKIEKVNLVTSIKAADEVVMSSPDAAAGNTTTTVIEMSSSAAAVLKNGALSLKPPISGLIAILKPSGCTSMSILDTLKPLLAQSRLFQVPANQELKEKQRWKSGTKRRRDNDRFTDTGDFMAPKIGQGGTLDPLADGVLVLGIGSGTKHLQQFLECTKEYKTVGLLGTSTLSYDANDPILLRRPYDHVTANSIQDVLSSFRGKFKQMPPLFSAIRIDGIRLFDYARQGKDLPRPVEKRDVEISRLELVDWKEGGKHNYKEPEKECDEIEKKVALRARQLAGMEPPVEVKSDSHSGDAEEIKVKVRQAELDKTKKFEAVQASGSAIPAAEETTREAKGAPPVFTLEMTVSSGTYVRSVVHDVGMQVESAAHVVRLSRTRQGDWISPEYQVKEGEDEKELKRAIDWDILQRAAEELSSAKIQKTKDGSVKTQQDSTNKEDNDGLEEWEQLFIDHMQIIET